MSLIQNGSFEDFDANPWNKTGDVIYVPSPVKEGIRAASLTFTSPSTNATISQNVIGLDEGSVYKLSYWVASSGATESYSIKIGTLLISGLSISSTTYQYREFSYTAPASPPLTTPVIFIKGSGTTIFIDYVVFIENLITNGSFEKTPGLTDWVATNTTINTIIVEEGFHAAQINSSGSLTTTIDTTVGDNYLLTYWASGTPISNYTLQIGISPATVFVADNSYGFQSIAFTASNTTTNITFTTDVGEKVIIDNVAVINNIVKNGGFGNSSIPGPVANWTLTNASAVISPTHYGNRAIKIEPIINPFPLPPTVGQISSPAPLITNHSYTVSLWAALQLPGSSQISVQLSGATTITTVLTVNSTDYTMFSFDVQGSALAASNIITILSINTVVYIDDVAITNVFGPILNGSFENLTIIDWTRTPGLNFVTSPVRTGLYAARILNTESITQNNIPTIIGRSYILGFYVDTNEMSTTYDVFINGIPTTNTTSTTVYDFVSIGFVATSSSTSVQFKNITSGTQLFIDDVSLLQDAVCFIGNSMVLTKNLNNGEIKEIPIELIKSNCYQVFSTQTKEFVSIKHNIRTGPQNRFVLIKKGLLGENHPNKDFYVTTGHVLIINGTERKAKKVRKTKIVTIDYQPIYTICTELRQPILVNNLEVMAYGLKEWYDYSTAKNIQWQDHISGCAEELVKYGIDFNQFILG